LHMIRIKVNIIKENARLAPIVKMIVESLF
jgi:hypothetical protein